MNNNSKAKSKLLNNAARANQVRSSNPRNYWNKKGKVAGGGKSN